MYKSRTATYERQLDSLYEYYKDYFDYYKLETSIQLIFKAPDKDEEVFKYQIKFVRWYLLKVLNLDISVASDAFDKWLSKKSYGRKVNKEEIEGLTISNFLNDDYITYDTFSISSYKENLYEKFGQCWCINEDRDLIISKKLLSTTKKELSDSAFKMLVQLLVHEQGVCYKEFTQNDIMHICNISRATFFRQIKQLVTTGFISKRADYYKLASQEQIDKVKKQTVLKDKTWQNEKKRQYYYFKTATLLKVINLDNECFRLYMKLSALHSIQSTGKAEITQETLAKWLGIDRTNIIRAIKKLEDKNIIGIRKIEHENKIHNLYTFIPMQKG